MELPRWKSHKKPTEGNRRKHDKELNSGATVREVQARISRLLSVIALKKQKNSAVTTALRINETYRDRISK